MLINESGGAWPTGGSLESFVQDPAKVARLAQPALQPSEDTDGAIMVGGLGEPVEFPPSFFKIDSRRRW